MLTVVKALAKQVPGIAGVYRRLRGGPRSITEELFADKMRRNAWRGGASVSGRGSDLDQTAEVVAQLPQLLREFRIKTMLDVPCGDYHWMRLVDRTGIHYIGGDIVTSLVEQNRQWESPDVEFRRLDLLTDAVPTVDLVFCRDCLVHLSNADAQRAVRNIVASGSTYLLTTTFPDRIENADIPTGRWRVLNLQAPPFNFPPPIRLVVEQCTEGGGKYTDKALGLWKIETLPATDA